MKKLLAILMILSVLLSLAACAGPENIRGEQSGADETKDEEFSLGEVEGLKYESKFVGLGCKLPSDWKFYSDEEIKEMNNMAADMAGEDYQEAVKNASLVYDMFASDETKMNNINVTLEKVNAAQLAVLDLANNYEKQIPTIKSAFENVGYTNVQCEVSTVNIGGKELTCLRSTAQIVNATMYQVSFSKKCNGYLAAIAVTAFDQDTLQELLDAFYWLG